MFQEKKPWLAAITRNTHLKKLGDQPSGLDVNNMIGRNLKKIHDKCNQHKLQSQSNKQKLLNEILDKMKKAIQYFKQNVITMREFQKKVIAVFDGSKICKIQKIKSQIDDELKANNISIDQVKSSLKGISFIEFMFDRKVYIRDQNQLYWNIYDSIIETLIVFLLKLGVQVLFAPYQADFQLIKLYQFGKINFVLTEDKGFLYHGVPILKNLQMNGQVDLIRVQESQLKEKSLTSSDRFINIARENPMKQAMFATLNNSKYLAKLKSIEDKQISTTLLIELIQKYNTLKDVLKILRENYKKFIIPQYYEEMAQALLIFHLLSPYYNPNSKKVEFADRKKFDLIRDRQLNIQNLQVIWNKNYSQEVRKGIVNINYNKVRQMVLKQLGKQY